MEAACVTFAADTRQQGLKLAIDAIETLQQRLATQNPPGQPAGRTEIDVPG